MTKEREDTRSDPPLTPASIREQAAYSLAIFGEDDGSRWLLRCATRIEELEKLDRQWVAAMPTCEDCDNKATNRSGNGDYGCDDHPAGSYVVPWIELIRSARMRNS